MNRWINDPLGVKELARKDLTGVEVCIGDDVDEDDAGFILLLEGDSSTYWYLH